VAWLVRAWVLAAASGLVSERVSGVEAIVIVVSGDVLSGEMRIPLLGHLDFGRRQATDGSIQGPPLSAVCSL
jgi:hypothetical protein